MSERIWPNTKGGDHTAARAGGRLPRGAAIPPAGCPSGQREALPNLDTPTPLNEQIDLGVKFLLSRRSGKIFSRSLLGVKKKARYYFLTVTTPPGGRKIRKTWELLRLWLKRQRPAAAFFMY